MNRFFAFFIMSLVASVAFAAGGTKSTEQNQTPIEIKSDHLVTDNNKRTATFTGKVVSKRGDLTIYSDKLVIHQNENSEMEWAEAIDNVVIIQGNRRGVAQNARYESAKGTIVLTGNPKLFQGDDTIVARVITYFIEEDKSTAVGGPNGGRVDVRVFPKAKETKDSGSKDAGKK